MNKCVCFVLLLSSSYVFQKIPAQPKTENLVIVTLDGMRWQEVFGGADAALLKNKNFTRDSADTSAKFWNDIVEKRKKFFPFLWSTVANNGQLYGNRTRR